MSTNRLESFSDGVLAVAITLLILNLAVPVEGQDVHWHGLAGALGAEWPQFVAYAISFLTIGIIWINHHAMISRLRATDRAVMFLNLLVLMSVVLIPFATNLMATYLRQSSGQHLAAAIYGGSLLLMGVLFGALNHHILMFKPNLLRVEIPAAVRRRILVRGIGGVAPYVLATALAPVSPYLTLGISGAVAVFYALPVASSGD